MGKAQPYPETPDGRYFAVKGCLWRKTNPNLSKPDEEQLVRELMAARRDVRSSKGDADETRFARKRVDAAKVA